MKRVSLVRVIECLVVAMMCFMLLKIGASAYDVSEVEINYDESTKVITISNVPHYDSVNNVFYELHGTLYFEDGTLVEAVSLSEEDPYSIPEKQAYELSWKDREFMLPASGIYTFKAWLTAYSAEDGTKMGRGPIESVTFKYKLQTEDNGWYKSGKRAEVIDEETCEMSEDTLVTVETIAHLQEEGIRLAIKKDDYEWIIDGSSVVRLPKEDVSLDTTFELDGYTKRDVRSEFGEIKYIPIRINHEGLFGFDAKLKFKIPADNQNKFANLFYAPGGDVFSYVDSIQVDEDGMISFDFVHASSFIVTITDSIYDPYAEVNDVTRNNIKTIEEGAVPEASGPVLTTGGVDGEFADIELAVIHDDFTYTKHINAHAIGVFVSAIFISVLISYFIIRKEIKANKIN